MIPSSTVALFLIVIAVLPGSMYTWAFERQAGAYGATLADRLLRFVAISAIFHLVLGWAEYFAIRRYLSAQLPQVWQFASIWLIALIIVVVPALFGNLIGSAYANRNTSRIPTRLLQVLTGRTPAPRAWDDLFSERPTVYLRIETVGGTTLAGLFANRSYAGGFPYEADIYLEQAWAVDEEGGLTTSLAYGIYVPSSQIAYMEVIPQQEEEGPGE